MQFWGKLLMSFLQNMIKEFEEQKLFKIQFLSDQDQRFLDNIFSYKQIWYFLFVVFMNVQSQILQNLILSVQVSILFLTAYLNNVTSRAHLLILYFSPLRNQCITSTHVFLTKASHMVMITPNFKGERSIIFLHVQEREENWKYCWNLVKLPSWEEK